MIICRVISWKWESLTIIFNRSLFQRLILPFVEEITGIRQSELILSSINWQHPNNIQTTSGSVFPLCVPLTTLNLSISMNIHESMNRLLVSVLAVSRITWFARFLQSNIVYIYICMFHIVHRRYRSWMFECLIVLL